jgi:SAM-dependent methyltransferase
VAFDRADVAALRAALSPGFLHFEGGTPRTRDEEIGAATKRTPGSPAVAERTWSHERVSVHEPYASFVGEALEREGNNDVHGGGYRFDGWYTLVWSREDGGWKLAFCGWRQGGAASERGVWNEIFHNDVGFEKEPNRLLVDTVAKLRPGKALDVAMGQGRNALWLASRGWKVTGVDFSDEGVRAARAAAAERHLGLDAVNADLETYDFGVAKWDLVTMIYVPRKPAWIERARRSLKPGGLLVLEYFRENDPGDGGWAPGELAGLFKDGFDVLRDDVVEGTPDWAVSKATLVRFVARKR